MFDFSRLMILAACLVAAGCASTTAVHDPIYPSSGESVTYKLEAQSRLGIRKLRLYETISTVSALARLTPGNEVLLEEWVFPDQPESVQVNHTNSSGYPENGFITYRLWVSTGPWGSIGGVTTHSREVSFAIRPYPVVGQPAPIYAQGDIDKAFDIVFIPDTDITNMQAFRQNCSKMITDAVFAEPSIGPWLSQQFNFYINPERGTATDYDRRDEDGHHRVPSNWANLSFAEAKVLMHANSLRDYASNIYPGLFSTEQQNRGTMMHEGGHSLFALADEYDSGEHWQASDYPNNWTTLAGARADASTRHKTAADAREIGTSGWYKLCVDACPMKVSGLLRNDYDAPCTDRVIFSIFDNAGVLSDNAD